MLDKTKAFQRTLGSEGGYTNDPADKGGPTRWGVTEAVARAAGYQGDMKDFPFDDAVKVYTAIWDRLGLDGCPDQLVAENLLDWAFNGGDRSMEKGCQHALNLLNNGSKLWPDVEVDGFFGLQTFDAMQAAWQKCPGLFLLQLCLLRGTTYDVICDGAPIREVFQHGWLNRLATFFADALKIMKVVQ